MNVSSSTHRVASGTLRGNTENMYLKLDTYLKLEQVTKFNNLNT